MEKAAAAVRVKNKFLKFLPRAASDVTLQRPPYSPTKRISDTGAKPGKAFSGPIIPLVPAEARRKPKSFETREPSSPKISCMGQIKIKHKNKQEKIKKKEKQHLSLPRDFKPVVYSDRPAKKKASSSSAIGKLFGGSRSQGRKSNASDHGWKPPRVPAAGRPAPGLNQMKRFASGREHALSSFDWTSQIAPVDRDQGDYFSDEEGEGEEEREVIIPFSAPIMRGGGGSRGGGGGGRGGEVVGLEPKKEINLWKRRTMAQPRPLQVN